jgi:hypothetical protein
MKGETGSKASLKRRATTPNGWTDGEMGEPGQRATDNASLTLNCRSNLKNRSSAMELIFHAVNDGDPALVVDRMSETDVPICAPPPHGK